MEDENTRPAPGDDDFWRWIRERAAEADAKTLALPLPQLYAAAARLNAMGDRTGAWLFHAAAADTEMKANHRVGDR